MSEILEMTDVQLKYLDNNIIKLVGKIAVIEQQIDVQQATLEKLIDIADKQTDMMMDLLRVEKKRFKRDDNIINAIREHAKEHPDEQGNQVRIPSPTPSELDMMDKSEQLLKQPQHMEEITTGS